MAAMVTLGCETRRSGYAPATTTAAAFPGRGVGEHVGQLLADRAGGQRGAVVVNGAVGLVKRGEIVATEVADGGGQGRVVQAGDERDDRLVAAGQPAAQLVGVAAQQTLVLGVGHGVDPVPQRVPAGLGEQLVQQAAVLSVMTCHPAAVNMPPSRSAAMSGTTRSSD